MPNGQTWKHIPIKHAHILHLEPFGLPLCLCSALPGSNTRWRCVHHSLFKVEECVSAKTAQFNMFCYTKGDISVCSVKTHTFKRIYLSELCMRTCTYAYLSALHS